MCSLYSFFRGRLGAGVSRFMLFVIHAICGFSVCSAMNHNDALLRNTLCGAYDNDDILICKSWMDNVHPLHCKFVFIRVFSICFSVHYKFVYLKKVCFIPCILHVCLTKRKFLYDPSSKFFLCGLFDAAPPPYLHLENPPQMITD